MSLDIKLHRVDKVYRPGDKVTGAVVVQSQGAMKHNGIKIQVEGSAALQLSARSIGLFEAFYSSLKPVQILNMEFDVAQPGKIPNGVTEFPFEFTLKKKDCDLYETYHGVYVNIQYGISCEITRPMLSGKSLKKNREFYVEIPGDSEIKSTESRSKPFNFKISPESLKNVKVASKRKIPDFLFEGFLDHTTCCVSDAFSGELVIRKCAVDIKSIELQLVRVESCTYMEGEAREATEIQNIPRLFTSSTTLTKPFKVEFEVNLIILFSDNHMVTENFPIKLYR